MTNSGAFNNQISNRNFLAPVGFKFTLAKFPKVTFFSNTARIPDITLGTAIQSTYLKDIDIPGEKLTFGDLNVRFLVDENLENYMKIHNWLTGLGFPESGQEFIDKITDRDGLRDMKEQFSDGSLHILNSNFNDIAVVKFKDLFPIFLTSLEFDATESDINFFTADVTFKYTIYDILSPSGKPL
tara:strand:- start:996 stop:1547 length:552 start_codon:yes stop_codon:yes gene_type:complete